MTNAWEKTGRDAAHEDIAGGAEPCTTLDEARRRIGQWLRSQTPAVAAVDADVCAAAYLRAWEAHARDTSHRAGLDLDAIEMRSRDNEDFRTYHLAQDSAADVPALLARVRDLTAKLDATAQAFDDLVAQVWTAATGSVHEGPASVGALLNTVLDMRNSRDALRYEVSTALHLPPTIGPAPGELARVMRATEEARDKSLAGLCPQGYVVIPLALHDAACRLASDVERLQREVDAARREGAEAMREACADLCDARARRSVDAGAWERAADALRALPLPGGAS